MELASREAGPLEPLSITWVVFQKNYIPWNSDHNLQKRKKEEENETEPSFSPQSFPRSFFFLIRQLYQVVLASSKNSKSNKIFTTTTGTPSCNPHFCIQYEATSSMLLLHGFLGVLGKRKRWIFWTVNHRVQGVNSPLVS